MIITLNTNITKEDTIKRIDALLSLANPINGNWDNDEAIFSWDQKLKKEINELFKSKVSIITELDLKGCYDNSLGIELTKITTPDNYDEKRRERNENNKAIFLHQLNKLLELKNNIYPSDKSQNEIKNETPSHSSKDKSRNNRIKIYISKDEGIYINKNRKYPIKKGRFDLIQKLRGEKIAMPLEQINYSNPLKEIKEINENFKKGLNLKEDIIIHISTGGYRLNRNNYEINFID